MMSLVVQVPWPVTVTFTFTCEDRYCGMVEVKGSKVPAYHMLPLELPSAWSRLEANGVVKVFCPEHEPGANRGARATYQATDAQQRIDPR